MNELDNKNSSSDLEKGSSFTKKAAKSAGNATKKSAKVAAKATSIIFSNPLFILLIAVIVLCLITVSSLASIFFGGGSREDSDIDIYDICIDHHEITEDFMGDGFEWVSKCRDEIYDMRTTAMFYSGSTEEDIENGGYAWDVTDPLYGNSPEADGKALNIIAESDSEFGDIMSFEIYPSFGNDNDGYSSAAIILRGKDNQKKTIRMVSGTEGGEAYSYNFGDYILENISNEWTKVDEDVYTPLAINVYDDVYITSLPYQEEKRNTLSANSYQNYIDGKTSTSKCFKVSLEDLIWLYKHIIPGKTEVTIESKAYDGDVPNAIRSVNSTGHIKDSLASAVLFESWVNDEKTITSGVNGLDWVEYGNCFTGKNFIANDYKISEDETWTNLSKYLNIEFTKEKIEDIIDFAKQIDGYIAHEYQGDVNQLFDGETKNLLYETDECQALWDQIFSDHYANITVLYSGNWNRSSPQCTDFASWRLWKQYGHGTAGGDGRSVAANLVKAYPNEFALSTNPKAGSIFSFGDGYWGHVGYVEKVEGDIMYTSEGNAGVSGTLGVNGDGDHSIKLNSPISVAYFKRNHSNLQFAVPIG